MRRAITLTAALVTLAGPAGALPVTWLVEGHIADIHRTDEPPSLLPEGDYDDPGLSDMGVVRGASFSMTVRMEQVGFDGNSSPNSSTFYDSILAMDFRVGSYHAAVGPGAGVSNVQVDLIYQLINLIGAQSNSVSDLFSNPYLVFQAITASGTLTSDEFPTDPPLLARLVPYNPFIASALVGTHVAAVGLGSDGVNGVAIDGMVSGLSRVPEPPAGALSLLPLALLLSRSRVVGPDRWTAETQARASRRGS